MNDKKFTLLFCNDFYDFFVKNKDEIHLHMCILSHFRILINQYMSNKILTTVLIERFVVNHFKPLTAAAGNRPYSLSSEQNFLLPLAFRSSRHREGQKSLCLRDLLLLNIILIYITTTLF